MLTETEATTWRILQTNGGYFQWEVISEDACSRLEEPPKTLVLEEDDKSRSRLSSMADILLQAEQSDSISNRSCIFDQPVTATGLGGVRGGDDCSGAMFNTGSGKTLSVRQSSIQKAKALLDGEDVADEAIAASSGSDCFPMFRTGLGKAVQVRQSSINKAVALLEGKNNKRDHLMDQLNTTFSKHKTDDKEILMDTSIRIGKSIDEDHIATFQRYSHSDTRDFGLPGNPLCRDFVEDHAMHEMQNNQFKFHPLKFHTAGGRSLSISAVAIERAKTLLNDHVSEVLDSEVKANELTHYTCDNENNNYKASSNITSFSFEILHEENFLNRNVLENPALVTPITSSSFSKQVSSKQDHLQSNSDFCSKPPNEESLATNRNVLCSKVIPRNRSVVGPLYDISNVAGSSFGNKCQGNSEKKITGKASSSSFKRPRTLRFTAPFNISSSKLAKTESALPSTSVNCCCRTRVSSRYPFLLQRKKLKEFFGGPPIQCSMIENVPESARYMTADNAGKFRFHDTFSSIYLGPEGLREMLIQSGALPGEANEKWVENHYKWIVWKLACLERCYPSRALCKFLTFSNVIEELKYRYEREFNYGHKSALRKILEGDISPSSMMILCVSAIRSCSGPMTDELLSSSDLHEDGTKLINFHSNYAVSIELTDGWYSVNATLDAHLSKQLLSGKLFVGQKLRVCGATLCGWVEPISPLEASNVSFVLHINGTFRARWDDSLGLCKGLGTPLAFKCIKGSGGRVSRTLVGISRLYPILYKERLPNGDSIVRSYSMENKILQLNSQRRSEIAEAILSEFDDAPVNVNDSGEGAKILQILECSAEPEVLMAGMSKEQLISFSIYREKQEALRQANLQKKIVKAFDEAGLGSRDVTPFMRVRVKSLISIGSSKNGRPREGLINIWNPTEKQKLDLVEGQIYSVSCLVPLSGSTDFLYLQTRGSSSEWIHLHSTDYRKFKPFFIPRKSMTLSNLGELPLASEFDISAVVVHVGKVYLSGCHRKQWIFVADGSGGISSSLTEDQHDDGLLAISFRSPISDNDSLAQINQNLSGSTVGFCNLIKRARDHHNKLWVAEATENSTYSICYNLSQDSHLKEAADSASKWANSSSLALKKLGKRVLSIIGDDGI